MYTRTYSLHVIHILLYVAYIARIYRTASARVNDCEQTNFDDFTEKLAPRLFRGADQRENSFGPKTIFTKGLTHARSSSDRVHNSHTTIIHRIIIKFFDKVPVKK